MKKREVRRHRTFTYGKRAQQVHLRVLGSAPSPGFFAKRKSIGCRCRRRVRNGSPKIVGSLCHRGDGNYHPCVLERIQGRRITEVWMGLLRAGTQGDDIET